MSNQNTGDFAGLPADPMKSTLASPTKARAKKEASRCEATLALEVTADAQAIQYSAAADELSSGCDSPMTVTEEARYDELNAVVHRHKDACRELWLALQVIHDQRLYRKKYKSFKEYCKKEHGFGRSHGYRMIEAAEVVKEVSLTGDPTSITNVHQALTIKKAKQRERQRDTAPAERVVDAPPVFPVEYVIGVAEEPASAEEGEAEAQEVEVPQLSRKIVPLPTASPMQLKSFAELKQMAADAHNMCSDRSRSQALANLLGKLETELDRWILYEKRQQLWQHQEAA